MNLQAKSIRRFRVVWTNRKQKAHSAAKAFPCRLLSSKLPLSWGQGEGSRGRKMPQNSLTDIQQFVSSWSIPLVVVFYYIPEFLKSWFWQFLPAYWFLCVSVCVEGHSLGVWQSSFFTSDATVPNTANYHHHFMNHWNWSLLPRPGPGFLE